MKDILPTLSMIALSAVLDSYAAFVVKLKFNELGKIDYSSWGGFFGYMANFFKSPLLLTGIIAFVCAPGIWFLVLNKIELSIGYPILVGFHLVFVIVFGVLFLDEGLTVNKLIGTGLIFLSLYFFYKK